MFLFGKREVKNKNSKVKIPLLRHELGQRMMFLNFLLCYPILRAVLITLIPLKRVVELP